MKQRCLPIHNLRQRNIRLLLLSFLLTGFALHPFFDASIRADEVLDEIGNSALADRNVKSALDVLRSQINKTRRELSPGLIKEFDQSVATRLKTIQESVSHNISTEYKSALMAKRILELSEHVMTLPYRKIAEDARQRKEAQQQYAAILDRFEKAAVDKTKNLNEQSRTLISGSLRQVLMDVQQDIFQPGFGRPLSDQEKIKLNNIIDEMLQEADGLPKVSDKTGPQAFVLRDAARVANNGRKTIIKFLRDREAGLAKNISFITAIKAWRSENATLEKAVDNDLKRADETEISAVIERANRQGEKDIQENNPKVIGAKAQAAAKEEERAIRNAPTTGAPSHSRWIVSLSILLVILIAVFVIRLRRKLKVR